jgi:hypothetical protein
MWEEGGRVGKIRKNRTMNKENNRKMLLIKNGDLLLKKKIQQKKKKKIIINRKMGEWDRRVQIRTTSTASGKSYKVRGGKKGEEGGIERH